MKNRYNDIEARPSAPRYQCEAEVAEGLDEYARDEIGRLGDAVRLYRRAGRDGIRFDYDGNLRDLLRLQTILAIYTVRAYPVPRPRALLGDEHLRTVLAQIQTVLGAHPPGTFRSLYLSAAGADSSVLTRFKSEIAARSGLNVAEEGEGDLLLRLRRETDGDGWEVLVRISPRPLSARAWRVCNMEGALNATVAHVMARLSRPHRNDFFLNLACGSGTLLIERLAVMGAWRVVGCDINADARACAETNIAASAAHGKVEITDWDVRDLPLEPASVDALVADLPFGHLIGTHLENVAAYPVIVREAARVAKPGAIFVLISHELRLLETILDDTPNWETIETIRIGLGGLSPRIFVLRRTPDQVGVEQTEG